MAVTLSASQRIALLLDRLAPALMPGERELLTDLRRRMQRVEQASGKFNADPLTTADGLSFVEVTWVDMPMQMSPNEARQLAGVLFDAATIADAMGFLLRFETQVEGLTAEDAGATVSRFRRYLIKDPGALAPAAPAVKLS